jgi:hypothetical protein
MPDVFCRPRESIVTTLRGSALVLMVFIQELPTLHFPRISPDSSPSLRTSVSPHARLMQSQLHLGRYGRLCYE